MAAISAADRTLFDRARQGDARALDRLVRANMGLVHSIAYKLGQPRSDADLADLVSEGSLGLVKAIRQFDPGRGLKFSTYAHHWIGHHVREARLDLQGRKRSDAQRGKLKRETDARVEAGMALDEAAAAVAEKYGMMVETVLGVHARLSARAVSIDKPVSHEGEMTFGDLLGEDPEIDEQVDRVRQLRAFRDRVADFRRTLAPREAAILDRRVLDEGDTLQGVADEFGISRERVRQIEVKLRGQLIALVKPPAPARPDAVRAPPRRVKPPAPVRRVQPPPEPARPVVVAPVVVAPVIPAGPRHCTLCGARIRRHNKRDRCRAHGLSATFDARSGKCLTCGQNVLPWQRGAHALAHRRGPPKTPEAVRERSVERAKATRARRLAAGRCVGCGGPSPCALCAARSRRRSTDCRRRAGALERVPRFYEHGGRLLPLARWAAVTGVPLKILFSRLHQHGWSVERALTEPLGLRPAKGTCRQGHPRTPDNLYLHRKSGRTHCKACMRVRCAARRRLPEVVREPRTAALDVLDDDPVRLRVLDGLGVRADEPPVPGTAAQAAGHAHRGPVVGEHPVGALGPPPEAPLVLADE